MAYKDYIKDFFNQARKSEKTLFTMYKEACKKAEEINIKNDVGSPWRDVKYSYSIAKLSETGDQFTKPKAIEEKGEYSIIVHGKMEQYPLKVWLSNIWMGSNKIPESVKDKVIDNRYPVRVASMWYTPYTHFTRWSGKQLTLDEFYKKAEKEKVLFFDFEVKISMVRRNAIPNKHSCQWCHKMSKPEYVMYLRDEKKLPAKQEERLKEIYNEIHSLRMQDSKADVSALVKEKYNINAKRYYWREVLNAETLSKLEIKARHVFNDWYNF